MNAQIGIDHATLKIRIFGRLTSIVGADYFRIDYKPDTERLREAVEIEYPQLASEAFTIAINRSVSTGIIAIARGSEVALLPPFSGG